MGDKKKQQPQRWYLDWWPMLVVVPAWLVAVGFYVTNFGLDASPVKGDWGLFGDFIGGLVNPLIAFFALVMLIIAVRLQRKELSATNIELEEQRKVMTRQLFEAQFFNTMSLLVAAIDKARAKPLRHEVKRLYELPIKQSGAFLNTLASMTVPASEDCAPIVSLVKVAANALDSHSQFFVGREIDHYASMLRGFISTFEGCVLLAAMHQERPGSPLELAVEKYMLIKGMYANIRFALWATSDRDTTVVGRLPANLEWPVPEGQDAHKLNLGVLDPPPK